MDRLLLVVVSVHNEEKVLEEFYRETTKVLKQINWNYELLSVNDDSRDGSQDILDRLTASDSGVKVISFSGSFGHEAAMITGLNYNRGDSIVCMDADLQHPPEYIPDILAKFGEGYQITNMVRIRNRTAGPVKGITSSGFYWLINRISDVYFETNASDFFAVPRHVTQVLKDGYRERIRFLRGYVQNAGFKKTAVKYEARARVAGESKCSIKKLFALSINTILCFSNTPLKFRVYVGIFSTLLGSAVMICTLYTRKGAPSSYATVVVLICFIFAMTFVVIGIIGEYIAILFTELKDRPIYTMDRMENMDQGENVSRTASITDRTEDRNQTKNAH